MTSKFEHRGSAPMFACFGCTSGDIPSDYVDLPRDQLKELYDRSIRLNSGRLIVHGIFARADKKNTNRRVYPKVCDDL